MNRLLSLPTLAASALLGAAAQAAAPGITGAGSRQPSIWSHSRQYLNQPDGNASLFLGLWLQRYAGGLCAGGDHRRDLPDDADARVRR